MPTKKTTETKPMVTKVKPKIEVKSAVKTARTALSVPVFSLAGRAAGTLNLPKEIFGADVNSSLLAQAMRVYLANQKGHFSHTKTRAEVEGSTRKIFRQKGTGRARHGAVRAPIFVGGGIALGPKSRKVILDLPKKMKTKALISALSQKMKDNEVLAISGLEKMTGKTKEVAQFIQKIGKKSALIVADQKKDQSSRAVRNLKGVELLTENQLNAYEVIKHQSLILTREAVEKLQMRLTKKEKISKETEESKPKTSRRASK
ncbi:50S ribosomal protein L4 [Candidatus Daviesbacteria bacterium]|nr:50S ribosomal protein L4 [Candidatus Daviesbacteria bacterium]